jgi:hypothetical protein
MTFPANKGINGRVRALAAGREKRTEGSNPANLWNCSLELF